MKKILRYLSWLGLLVSPAYAQQTNSKNYLLTRDYKDAGANANDVSKVVTNLQYTDGLGRTMQHVTVAQNPDGNDLVVPFTYDDAGRSTKDFLPYVSVNGKGAFQATAPASAEAWYVANSAGLLPEGLGRPFIEKAFEQSPLSRAISLRAPGNKSVASAIKYKVNAANEVARYDFNTGNNTLVPNGAYAAGALQRIHTTDEQGNEQNEYMDMLGRVVCKKVLTGTETLETHYIYDDFDQLRIVLQPKYQQGALLEENAFVYQYDNKGRLISKQVPGGGLMEIVYDKYFRTALSRDANQKSRNVWEFTKYDALNRPIVTGEITSPLSRTDWQITFDGSLAHHEIATAGGIGYTLNATQPVAIESNVLTVTYFDQYNFPKKSGLNYHTASAYYPAANTNVKSLETGGKVRLLPGDGTVGGLLTYSVYYDDEYREIQRIRELHELGSDAVERISTKYKYTLAPVISERKTEQILSAVLTHTHIATYTHDHADRLLSIKEKVSDGSKTTELLTVANRYNALGQLKSKWYHSLDNTKFRLRTDYINNIRGWLASAKSVYKETQGGNELPYFNQSLAYANGNNYTNGNVSKLQWSGKDVAAFDRGLEFVYDKANRLKEAKSPAGAAYTYAETETGIEYDQNGNIKKLKRGGTGGLIDNLNYTYLGNKLFELVESSGNNLGIKTGNLGFGYDLNGNMVTDGTRAATLTYNYLNLPQTVTIAGKTQTYDYDATGVKHKYVADTLILKYAGIFEYRKVGNSNKLYRISLAEGQAVYRNGKLDFDYYLKDHLGNTRVVFDGKGNILQKTDYYPFGLGIPRDVPAQTAAVRNGVNRYHFLGKEQQVGTGYIDLQARFYDPGIGRFLQADPLTEQFPTWSSYNYSKNNPIRFKDVDGLAPFDITLLGVNNSSVTVKTDLVDLTVNASSLGVDFGGNYTLSGNDVLQAAVDIGGVFDPTPTLDVVGAGLSANSGDYWGAGASVLGAALPYVGDLAKTGKIAKGVDKISDAIDAAKGSEKTMETSRAARREAMRDAGIPTSQQPSSQSKNASGREYSYEVPKNGGGKQTKSVQQQTMDRSHQGQKHWEAGGVKTDEGKTRMNNYGRPKLDNDKAKVNY